MAPPPPSPQASRSPLMQVATGEHVLSCHARAAGDSASAVRALKEIEGLYAAFV